MNTISFMTANYVARPIGYHMTEGWMQGEDATVAYFKPAETFSERFDLYLRDIRAMGFEALDLWLGILHPAWASDQHLNAARDLLGKHGLRVTSLAGWFGESVTELEAVCRMAAALNTDVLAGRTGALDTERAGVIDLLERYNLRYGIENHPEKTAAELLTQIGDGDRGRVGAALDTGWFGTQGFDAAQAVRELRGHLVIVHLKDVLAAGAHDTCRFGAGIVPVQACVAALRQMGYAGVLCVEHEPEHFDPTEDCIASLALLKGWLA